MTTDALSTRQFTREHTLGNLSIGDHFHLPGREGTLTVARNDVRAGKSRIMYTAEGDDQQLGYVGPAASHVDVG